jgi:hypothetical protein
MPFLAKRAIITRKTDRYGTITVETIQEKN